MINLNKEWIIAITYTQLRLLPQSHTKWSLKHTLIKEHSKEDVIKDKQKQKQKQKCDSNS